MENAMNTIITSSFELGATGFMLLIVLMTVLLLVSKMATVFSKMPDKFDVLTERIAESNKELSNQLIKTSTVQENILSIMKETMISVNNNTVKMAVLEEKVEKNLNKIEEVVSKNEDAIGKLCEIDAKLELGLLQYNKQ